MLRHGPCCPPGSGPAFAFGGVGGHHEGGCPPGIAFCGAGAGHGPCCPPGAGKIYCGSFHHGIDCPAEGAGTGAGSGVVECSAGGFDGPCCPCLEVGEGMGGLLFLAVSGYGPLGGIVQDVEEPVSAGPCCPACFLSVKKNIEK